MNWDNNIYSHPEKHGLVQVGELDDPQACWSFDYLVVWHHPETGRLFWATDAGCSCPTPFENYENIDSLDPITDETWDTFQAAVEEHCKYEPDKIAHERTELIARVLRLQGRLPAL